MTAEAEAKLKVEAASALLLDLHKRLPDMLKERNRLDAGFQRRCYSRWKPGMDLLRMFLIVSQEFGSAYNQRARPQAVSDANYKFEAIVALHARSLRVANEILVLLRAGYPDGALSRWRTLHELAVMAAFLAMNDQEIAKRFLAHRGIVCWKAMQQHQRYIPQSGMAPFESNEMEDAEQRKDHLLKLFGREFKQDMGWAYPAIPKTRGITLLDLEEATGLDHWRPRYKWASDDIHGGSKPYHASLSAAEVPLDQPVLVVGQSNSAFTDPAHMCVITLNIANHALPEEYRTDEDELVLIALRMLSDVTGNTFWEVDQETGKKSARARSERPPSDGKGGRPVTS
jgi:hypothetical protein